MTSEMMFMVSTSNASARNASMLPLPELMSRPRKSSVSRVLLGRSNRGARGAHRSRQVRFEPDDQRDLEGAQAFPACA